MHKRSIRIPEKLQERIAKLTKIHPHYTENAIMVEAMIRGLPSFEREVSKAAEPQHLPPLQSR